VTFLEKRASGVVFVDTPGFDEMSGSDSEVLEMIAQWLKRKFVTLPLDFYSRDVRVLL
jgi:GTPase Era involved in 16S rRNA processing